MAALEGRRIAVTRAPPDAGALAARLRALGAEPVLTPAIETVLLDAGPLEAALERNAELDWIVFTSRHAADAVARCRRSFPGIRIAAVGEATATALENYGIPVDLIPREHTAEGLLAALGDLRGQVVLFPASAIARRTLPDGLRARGADVREVPVYETRPAATRYAALAGVDAITFTSPSTVTGLLAANGVPPGARVVCIGPTTAAAARAAGLAVTEVAEPHTEDGLLDALLRVFGDETDDDS